MLRLQPAGHGRGRGLHRLAVGVDVQIEPFIELVPCHMQVADTVQVDPCHKGFQLVRAMVLVIHPDVVEVQQDAAVCVFGHCGKEVGLGHGANVGVPGAVLDRHAAAQHILHRSDAVTHASNLFHREGNGKQVVQLMCVATGGQVVGVVLRPQVVDQLAQFAQKRGVQCRRPAQIE